MTGAIEAGLRRHRAIMLTALAVLCLLAWGWLFTGAGMHATDAAMENMTMPAGAMDGMDGMDGMAMSQPAWSLDQFALVAAMWWTMMVAMMLPSAAPTVLLYARTATRGSGEAPSSGAFLTGYLIVWMGFSVAATLVQLRLESALILSPMAMAIEGHRLTGALLIAVGLYQLSPVKGACLRQCRNPAAFLQRHYRSGAMGALRMGLIHGAWCLGCCWALMALLLIGGVMNLAWIAMLTLLVAAEKLLPLGQWTARGAGLACLVAGAYLLAQ